MVLHFKLKVSSTFFNYKMLFYRIKGNTHWKCKSDLYKKLLSKCNGLNLRRESIKVTATVNKKYDKRYEP